jgi:muramidase (phage lysozyme)
VNINYVIAALIAAGLAVVYALDKAQPAADPGGPPLEGDNQLTTPIEDLQVTLDPTSYTPAAVAPSVADVNQKAFLDMIAYAEGADYNTLFGGGTFDSYADHPRKIFKFTNSRGEMLETSAAGRYQFLARTWDSLQRRLQLPDFSPDSQDAAALELIRERGALADVQAGRVQAAITKCAPIWASLPGAGYAQPERKLPTLIAQYQAAGGNLEA